MTLYNKFVKQLQESARKMKEFFENIREIMLYTWNLNRLIQEITNLDNKLKTIRKLNVLTREETNLNYKSKMTRKLNKWETLIRKMGKNLKRVNLRYDQQEI